MTADTWAAALAGFELLLETKPSREGEKGKPVRQTTRWQYAQHVRWLADGVESGPWELETFQLATWLDGHNWSRETRRKVLVSLRAFYAWGVGQGLIEWAPVAGIQSPKPKSRGPEPLAFTREWAEPGDAFLRWLRAGKRSEGTIGQRSLYLRRLSQVARDPWTVTAVQLADWLANPGWKPQTTRVARASIREFYRWAVLDGRIEISPAANLQSVQCPRSLPRPIPDTPLTTAVAAADERTRLMLLLGALAGLRRAEIANLHARSVSETELFVVGKGGHHRRVPMHPTLWEELRVEIGRRRDGRHGIGWGDRFVTETGYLFPSDMHPGPLTASHVGKLMGRVLPEPWTPHTLRHRFATMSYAAQRDLLAVQQLLGHAKPETTAVYAAVPDGALRTAVLGVTL